MSHNLTESPIQKRKFLNILNLKNYYQLQLKQENRISQETLNEWKQRQGILKFRQHKETKKCRILMRQDASYVLRANHIVQETIVINWIGSQGWGKQIILCQNWKVKNSINNIRSVLFQIKMKLKSYFYFIIQIIQNIMDPHPDDDDQQVGEDYDPEQPEKDEFKGEATLPPVPPQTGEEEDEEVAKFRAKMYRFADGQWKERGVGDLKFLKNKQTQKIRLLMRQDKTGKVIANHWIIVQEGLCKLTQLKTAEKSWIWTCYDASDEQPKIWQLCVRFTSVEEVERFKTEFEKSYENNKVEPEPEKKQE